MRRIPRQGRSALLSRDLRPGRACHVYRWAGSRERSGGLWRLAAQRSDGDTIGHMWWLVVVCAVAAIVLVVVSYDLTQRRHAILRNFPVVGHLRYVLEKFGPELRQYIVTNNDEERPFSRDQRRWIYATAKGQDNLFGFGTDNDLELRNSYVIVKQSAFPRQAPPVDEAAANWPVPMAKVLGATHRRAAAFRPASIVNISAMSFGSLSGPAVEALNRGAAAARCLHNTGEGGISAHHGHGGELVWQIGTGYFGCRDGDGHFDLGRCVETAAAHPVRAIEIKLSQGAKPGLGGILPAAKVTPEIAAARGVEAGRDCISPPGHSAFGDVDSLVEFVEAVAAGTGLPVGIKSAVGELAFWEALSERMARTGGGPDFVTIDGGEGGTGAAPLVFADHVALPFKVGMSSVYRVFEEAGLAREIVFLGAGKLGIAENALLAFALGCDGVNVGREAMMAVGCIQAQRCHTGNCPTGVATQSAWRARGLVPSDKAPRAARYVAGLRREILRLSRTCGHAHPAFVTCDDFVIVDGRFGANPAAAVFRYEKGWGRPASEDLEAVRALMS